MSLNVEYVVQPQTLLLAWQAPRHLLNRRRWLVARIDVTRPDWVLHYLFDAAFEEANPGESFAAAKRLGFKGYPAFTMREPVHGSRVRQSIMRRLPPRSRPDFGLFVSHFGLRDGPDITDEVLAAYTGARVPSDGFSVAAELEADLTHGDLVLEIAGTRHQMPEDFSLRVGDRLRLQPEPENEHDPSAVAFISGDCRIGYVNRLQAGVLRYWSRERALEAFVQRVNGSPMEPRVFALVRIRPMAEAAAA